jgi:hypothetical protein
MSARPPIDALNRLIRDVLITTPLNNHQLKYDQPATKWKNTPSGAGTGDFSTNTATSAAREIVVFADTTGKLGARSGILCRIKTDGSFQLWNPDQSKFHTISVAGTAGAEYLVIGAGET